MILRMLVHRIWVIEVKFEFYRRNFLHGGAAMFAESVTLTLPGPDLS